MTTDFELLPSPEPGELGRTIVTDVLVGESEQVRIVARQVVVFRSCVSLRLELIRAPGSSIENWWENSRAALRQRNIVSAGDVVDASGGFRIEIVEGFDVIVREGAGGGEDRLVVDYCGAKQTMAGRYVLQFHWPDFGIEGAELVVHLSEERSSGS